MYVFIDTRARSDSDGSRSNMDTTHAERGTVAVSAISLFHDHLLSSFVENYRLAALGHEVWQLRTPTASAAHGPGEARRKTKETDCGACRIGIKDASELRGAAFVVTIPCLSFSFDRTNRSSINERIHIFVF